MEKGLTVREIAKEIGVCYVTTVYRLKEFGLKAERRVTFDDIPWEEAVQLYERGGFSLVNIGKRYGTSSVVIAHGFSKLGVKIRSMPEQIAVDKSLGRGHVYVNEQFFNDWTSEMAYVLGWIATDGNVVRDLRSFRITSCDIEHLRGIASLFAPEGTISIKKGKGNWSDAGTLAISRGSMARRLVELGITPNKSLTLRMPEVPDDAFGHFFRGVFEGDGCFTLRRNKTTKVVGIKATIASGSRAFLEDLNTTLMRVAGIPSGFIHEQRTGEGGKFVTYSLNFCANGVCETLFRFMYDDVPEVMRLDRKWRKMRDYFAERRSRLAV